MKYSVMVSFNDKFLRFFTYLADNHYISANSINK